MPAHHPNDPYPMTETHAVAEFLLSSTAPLSTAYGGMHQAPLPHSYSSFSALASAPLAPTGPQGPLPCTPAPAPQYQAHGAMPGLGLVKVEEKEPTMSALTTSLLTLQ